ncbi:MAG: sensor histidine kinase [Gammaproteobacteria bacterium]
MVERTSSLRNRVALAFAVFGALVSLLLAVTIYVGSHNLEAGLIDDTLTAELEDYIARRARNPRSPPEHTTTISAFVVAPAGGTDPLPEAVRTLSPGFHDIAINGVAHRAAARAVGDQTFVVVYELSAVQQRERGFKLLLIGSVLLVTLASALMGRWLAQRTLAPVTELARRVARLQPEDAPTALADEFRWDEVRALARDFDVYRNRLHAFIQREQLFTGDISHELRTPTTVIQGAAELMRLDARLDAKNRARVERIHRASSEMHEISSALLALAREQGEDDSAPHRASALTVIDEQVGRYRAIFAHKPVRLSVNLEAAAPLDVDRPAFSITFGNLLRNALGFTDQGEVTVTMTGSTISIEDTGPGLGSADPDALFAPFSRGADSGGTGIGLSLVWRLCERRGWRIRLRNRSGGGTLATLELATGDD